LKEINSVLKKYWGFDEFRFPQEKIITSILEKNDTIALLPTGGGKSLCYQLPALVFEGKTLVISPLIALMEDQVTSLLAKGIKAKAIHSNLQYKEIDFILDNFVYGDIKLLYISPERIASEMFIERFKRTNIDLIAVDEAHCISQWGYDFRPSYFDIIKLRDYKPNVPFLALTATATPKVIQDITLKLDLRNPQVFKKSFTRNNISFIVMNSLDKNTELLHLIKSIRACGIIYVRNRKETIAIAEWLRSHGISATSYHGGMDKTTRDDNQVVWMQNKVQWMVSTNAFGMGIDKPDVRMVIHLDVTSSLEEYYQEAGRAGRDGKESLAVVLIDDNDIAYSQANIEDQFPNILFINEIYDSLCRFCKVAFGSGIDEKYDFNLNDFCLFASVSNKKAYHALQIIEKDGWVSFNEGYKESTKLMIVCDHQDLYFSDQMSESKNRLITHLLRKYEGLFIDFVRIDEAQVAKELNTTESILIGMLKLLRAEGILDIKFKKSNPQICFHLERPQIGNFKIDSKSYEIRKNMAIDRLEAMHQYLLDENQCRQAMILTYFGEGANECGKCDYCRYSAEGEIDQKFKDAVLDHLRNVINQVIQLDIKTFVKTFPYNKRRKVTEVFKELISEDVIAVDDKGIIKVLNS